MTHHLWPDERELLAFLGITEEEIAGYLGSINYEYGSIMDKLLVHLRIACDSADYPFCDARYESIGDFLTHHSQEIL